MDNSRELMRKLFFAKKVLRDYVMVISQPLYMRIMLDHSNQIALREMMAALPASVFYHDKPEINQHLLKQHKRKNRVKDTYVLRPNNSNRDTYSAGDTIVVSTKVTSDKPS